MKSLKYILFLSILSSLFILVYRQSDKKGFRRLWISFRMAAFMAAILAGLIPNPVEASETYTPSTSNSSSIERLVVDKPRGGFKKNNKPENQHPKVDQNKAGQNELPDSSNSKFIYNLESRTAKTAVKNVLKNENAKKEVLDGLDKMDKGELLPRNQKNFKKFKTLKEIKLTNTRMLVRPGKDGAPDEIVVICMKRDIDTVEKNLKKKYN